MADKINIHEQLLVLLNEKYITRGEYLLSIKDSLISLGDKVKVHEQLNELLQNNYITKDEYLVLIKDNLTRTEEKKLNISKEINKTEQITIDKNIIQRIKNAGSNVLGIYYFIIFILLLNYTHGLLLDVKNQYYFKENGLIKNYSEINGITKIILELKNIDSIIEKLQYLNEIYYLILFFVFPIFLIDLNNLGNNLKNVDKEL